MFDSARKFHFSNRTQSNATSQSGSGARNTKKHLEVRPSIESIRHKSGCRMQKRGRNYPEDWCLKRTDKCEYYRLLNQWNAAPTGRV